MGLQCLCGRSKHKRIRLSFNLQHLIPITTLRHPPTEEHPREPGRSYLLKYRSVKHKPNQPHSHFTDRMSRSSHHGSHSSSYESYGGYGSHSSRSRSGRPDDSRRGPPISFFNPFGSGSSSRRPSLHDDYARERRPSSHRSSYNDVPLLGRSSSSRRPSERPIFGDLFGSSSHSAYNDTPFAPSSRSGSRSRFRYYDDMPLRPPPGRRGGEDLSANAGDFYDPFAGGLGTGSARRPSAYGDPDLPRYRSASDYARGSASHPPGYDYPGRYIRGSQGFPPPYSSFSNQGGYGPDPMQFPPTRRPSHYDSGSGVTGLPPPDYFSKRR